MCRNDLLNFGRLHFFFPDSRLALDLNTDKTLKARANLLHVHAPTLSYASDRWLFDKLRLRPSQQQHDCMIAPLVVDGSTGQRL